MTTHTIQSHLEFSGEVIETFERDGKRIAKVSLKSCHIDVPIDLIPDVHLGDTLVLEADVTVQQVKTHPHE
jgi:hypothetical protein